MSQKFKLTLTEKHITFLMEFLETDSPEYAVEDFCVILVEEGLQPTDAPMVIDKIIKKLYEKKK